MKLTSQAVANVKFRSRGKWYHAGQVDAFMESLRAETARCREREETYAAVLSEGEKESERRLLCRELEKERDRLIQDIKALQDFREAFRASIERDVTSLTEQIKGFESDKLL